MYERAQLAEADLAILRADLDANQVGLCSSFALTWLAVSCSTARAPHGAEVRRACSWLRLTVVDLHANLTYCRGKAMLRIGLQLPVQHSFCVQNSPLQHELTPSHNLNCIHTDFGSARLDVQSPLMACWSCREEATVNRWYSSARSLQQPQRMRMACGRSWAACASTAPRWRRSCAPHALAPPCRTSAPSPAATRSWSASPLPSTPATLLLQLRLRNGQHSMPLIPCH